MDETLINNCNNVKYNLPLRRYQRYMTSLRMIFNIARKAAVIISGKLAKCKAIHSLNLNEEKLKAVNKENTAEVELVSKQVYTIAFECNE